VNDKELQRDLVGSGRGLILSYYPGIRLDGLRETTNTVLFALTLFILMCVYVSVGICQNL
jgi:hypothetical protein